MGGKWAEPVLDVDEIQGHVLAGFDLDCQLCLFFEITDPDRARRWLRTLLPSVTTVHDLVEPAARRNPSHAGSGSTSVAFTFQGLRKLRPDADRFREAAFKHGLHMRSALLGDARDAREPSSPANWVVGGPHNEPDVLLLLAAESASLLKQVAGPVEAGCEGLRVLFRQECRRLTGAHGPIEHFGFHEPISQPGVRGRIATDPDHLLTPRRNPADPNQGYPGQNLVWPGEFIFGQPGQSAMSMVAPGPVVAAGPPWAVNGSFLVCRRLVQDVAGFRAFVRAAAAQLSSEVPALAGLTPEGLAAKLLGRWPSGAPLLLAPRHDEEAIGSDARVNNDFGFVNRSRAALPDDVLGLICPHAAHVRKAYPRDHPTSEIVHANVETHRLLRRGLPFGDPFPAAGERGLLFLAYQTSFERQFEFVTRAWLNNPNLQDGGDGHDPIAGQNGNRTAPSRHFQLPVVGESGDLQKIRLELPANWVTPTGGGYFFTPSLSALRLLSTPS